VLQKRVDFPRGNPENRMSDGELRDKFVECAGARMDAAQIDRIIDTCMKLDRLGDVGELMDSSRWPSLLRMQQPRDINTASW